jgi:hypothetical protein
MTWPLAHFGVLDAGVATTGGAGGLTMFALSSPSPQTRQKLAPSLFSWPLAQSFVISSFLLESDSASTSLSAVTSERHNQAFASALCISDLPRFVQ